mgnify:CR=1 FL=1
MSNPFKVSYTNTDDKHTLTLGVGYVIIAASAIAYGVFKLATR